MFLEEILGQLSNTTALLLSAGLLVGLSHAFEPDHMAAMLTQVKNNDKKNSTLIARLKSTVARNSLLGVFWGFGHTSMILLVSFLVFVFAFNIPSQIFDGFELMVGVMLIMLGISMYTNKKIFQLRHSHPHTHENGTIHTHPHEHNHDHSHNHKSYLIGCLHGLAGSGSLIAISAATLDNIQGIFSFVIIFGIGSIIGMMIVSGTLSLPFILSNNFDKLKKILQILTGTISVIIGFNIIFGLSSYEGFFNFLL